MGFCPVYSSHMKTYPDTWERALGCIMDYLNPASLYRGYALYRVLWPSVVTMSYENLRAQWLPYAPAYVPSEAWPWCETQKGVFKIRADDLSWLRLLRKTAVPVYAEGPIHILCSAPAPGNFDEVVDLNDLLAITTTTSPCFLLLFPNNYTKSRVATSSVALCVLFSVTERGFHLHLLIRLCCFLLQTDFNKL